MYLVRGVSADRSGISPTVVVKGRFCRRTRGMPAKAGGRTFGLWSQAGPAI